VTFNRLFGLVTIALVAAGVALAFLFLGTPSHQRSISLDETRVRDLQAIASSLDVRYQRSSLPERLPDDLVLLDNGRRDYEYRRVDATHYRLCTVFAASYSPRNDGVYLISEGQYARNWQHGVGRTCYQFNATQSPPVPQR
jgi:hypothetical protein